MTKQGISKVLAILSATYDKEISPPLIQAYSMALGDLDDARGLKAAGKAITTLKFFPKPAELLELAGAQQAPVQHRAELAWAKVQKAVSRLGAYQSVEFECPTTGHAVLAMGGWQALCRPSESETWMRKRFIDTFQAYDGTVEASPQFLGLHDGENGGKPQYQLIGGDDARRLEA